MTPTEKKLDWENFDFYAAWKTRIDKITFPTSVELRHDDMNDLKRTTKTNLFRLA